MSPIFFNQPPLEPLQNLLFNNLLRANISLATSLPSDTITFLLIYVYSRKVQSNSFTFSCSSNSSRTHPTRANTAAPHDVWLLLAETLAYIYPDIYQRHLKTVLLLLRSLSLCRARAFCLQLVCPTLMMPYFVHPRLVFCSLYLSWCCSCNPSRGHYHAGGMASRLCYAELESHLGCCAPQDSSLFSRRGHSAHSRKYN